MKTHFSFYRELCFQYGLEMEKLGTKAYQQLQELCKTMNIEVDLNGISNLQAIGKMAKAILSVSKSMEKKQQSILHETEENKQPTNNVAITAQDRAKVLSNYFNQKDR